MLTMRSMTVLTVCLAIFAGTVMAQTDAAPAAMPTGAAAVTHLPAEPIMGHIPAGAMGYVVVNNVTAMGGNVERFLEQTGLREMLGMPEMPGWLVGMIKGAAQLGEGFNPNGGFAVVMLDPQQYGVDMVSLMGMAQPTTAPVEQPKPPVLMVCCSRGSWRQNSSQP